VRREEDAGEDPVHAEDGEDAEELRNSVDTFHLEEPDEAGVGDLLDQYLEMANDAEHEREVIEWSEGLIGDAFAEE
jgi:hypothetical protein